MLRHNNTDSFIYPHLCLLAGAFRHAAEAPQNQVKSQAFRLTECVR